MLFVLSREKYTGAIHYKDLSLTWSLKTTNDSSSNNCLIVTSGFLVLTVFLKSVL